MNLRFATPAVLWTTALLSILPATIAANPHDATVMVCTPDACASGVLLDRNTLVTNHHVVQFSKEVRIRFTDGTFSPPIVSFVAEEFASDLILLRVSDEVLSKRSVEPIRFSPSDSLHAGIEVTCVGHAEIGVDGLQRRHERNLWITHPRRLKVANRSIPYFLLDDRSGPETLPVHGMSGGGCYSKAGLLAGILSGGAPFTTWMVGSDAVSRLLSVAKKPAALRNRIGEKYRKERHLYSLHSDLLWNHDYLSVVALYDREIGGGLPYTSHMFASLAAVELREHARAFAYDLAAARAPVDSIFADIDRHVALKRAADLAIGEAVKGFLVQDEPDRREEIKRLRVIRSFWPAVDWRGKNLTLPPIDRKGMKALLDLLTAEHARGDSFFPVLTAVQQTTLALLLQDRRYEAYRKSAVGAFVRLLKQKRNATDANILRAADLTQEGRFQEASERMRQLTSRFESGADELLDATAHLLFLSLLERYMARLAPS